MTGNEQMLRECQTVEVTLEMVAAGEEIFRQRFAEHCRGAAPVKAVCEAAAIAIFAAMSQADTRPSLLSDEMVDKIVAAEIERWDRARASLSTGEKSHD